MKIEEKIFFLLFLLGLLLKCYHLPANGLILIVSLSALSTLYFPLAVYSFATGSNEIEKRLSEKTGLFLAIIPIAWLFKIQHYPGANIILFLGIVISLIALFIFYWKKYETEFKAYYSNMFYRITLLLMVSLIIYLI